jgi:pyruvate-formate lyase
MKIETTIPDNLIKEFAKDFDIDVKEAQEVVREHYDYIFDGDPALISQELEGIFHQAGYRADY